MLFLSFILYNKLYNYVIKALVLLHLCIIRNAGVVGSNPIGGTIFQSITRTPGPAVSTMIIGLAPSGVW